MKIFFQTLRKAKRVGLFVTCVSLILLFACNASAPSLSSYNYPQIARQIRKQTILQLKKEKNLSAIGTGGRMLGDIQEIDIDFNYYQPVDLTEARSLLVSAIQTFLKNINESKEIRPFLHNYPATVKDIEIVIFVYQENKKKPFVGEIQVIEAYNNRLFYKLAVADKFAPWPILKEESYEEALQLLGQE